MAEFLIQVAVPGPFFAGLTYTTTLQADIALIGCRVLVPLRKREVVGVVIGFSDASAREVLKPVIRFMDERPLIPKSLLQLVRFMHEYYHVSMGDAYAAALPSLLLQDKSLQGRRRHKPEPVILQENIVLNAAQQDLSDKILVQSGFGVHLLEGLTGSGKTEVYLKVAEAVLAEGKAVLILVPEIGLTPQTIERVRKRLGQSVFPYHSGLTEPQKRDCWLRVLKGEAKIVVGTRSAVFLPFQDLGLVVIDEEHDPSYKQQTGVHYSAKNMALMRARDAGARVILGSATPSAEAYFFAKQGTYQHHLLGAQSAAKTKNPVTVVDMRKFRQVSGLSKPFLEAMEGHLQAGGQVLIFLNRRGYAPVLICDACAKRLKCDACDMSYTVHQQPSLLICHHCGRTRKVPQNCGECGGQLITLGQGTEQIATYLATKFPAYPLLRLDQDVIRKKGEREALLSKIESGEAKIIIGTQMLAKGHDFHGITWVGVVDLDYGFFAPDFRAIERMGQLLTQVSGRAGRGLTAGAVMLQTHVPDHPLLKLLLQEGYPVFLEQLLKDRRAANWPPFSYLALLRAEARNPVLLEAFLREAKHQLVTQTKVTVLGPIPAFLKKKNHAHRAQILLESGSRQNLHQALFLLEQLKVQKNQVRFWIDVDPIEIG